MPGEKEKNTPPTMGGGGGAEGGSGEQPRTNHLVLTQEEKEAIGDEVAAAVEGLDMTKYSTYFDVVPACNMWRPKLCGKCDAPLMCHQDLVNPCRKPKLAKKRKVEYVDVIQKHPSLIQDMSWIVATLGAEKVNPLRTIRHKSNVFDV